MNKHDDGGTAYPARVFVDRDDPNTMRPYQFANNGFETPGMTLRDHFAGLAMLALIAKAPFIRDVDTQEEADAIARDTAISAYEYADAMLKERSK